MIGARERIWSEVVRFAKEAEQRNIRGPANSERCGEWYDAALSLCEALIDNDGTALHNARVGDDAMDLTRDRLSESSFSVRPMRGGTGLLEEPCDLPVGHRAIFTHTVSPVSLHPAVCHAGPP